ncbi:DUF4239 domain-containing protein [Microbacterium sp. cf046]|uniref:bestrophin-like domain n=1 Tax=Microbacterium sp. cf046 TaxID=1761803 RepID=UPI000B89AB7E|nr:DUF4239 domain-containing protein [Microbacterium sp. cf046]
MWLYEVPIAIAMPLFVALFIGISLLIVIALRKWVPRTGDGANEWDRVLGYAMASYGVLYGVTLALIAAASYENYRGVEEIVLQETSAISVLYRDAAGFPEPTSTELKSLLVEYTDHVISVDWVSQAGGVLPSHTSKQATEIAEVLFSFEPANESEANLHLATITAFNDFIGDRGARIGATAQEIPPILWLVLYTGALINAVLIGLVEVGRLRIHLTMAGLVAAFVGIVIFAIASFDHIYMGEVAIDTTLFEELRNALLMKNG